MNTQRKELGADKGESSQTFFGMLGWVRRHRPPLIVTNRSASLPANTIDVVTRSRRVTL